MNLPKAGGVLVIAFFVVLAFLWLIPHSPDTQQKLVAISHPAKGLTFVASLPDSLVRFNPSSQETENQVHLEFLSTAPVGAFTLNACAELPGTSAHCEDWAIAGNNSLDLKIGSQQESSGESEWLSNLVRGLRGNKPRKITVTLRASPADKLPFRQAILTLSPVYVEVDSFSSRSGFALRRFRQLLGDLSLPILATILGFFFSRQASRRAEENEVRRHLLDKVQEMTSKYYTHLVHHARYAIAYLKKADGTSDTINNAKFHLLALLLYNARLKNEEGAVFFSDLNAEQVYQKAIAFIFEQIRNDLGGESSFRAALASLQQAADEREPNPSEEEPQRTAPQYKDFLAVLETEGNARLSEVANWRILDESSAEGRLLVSALDFLKAVTSYEFDAPLYEHWYKQPGKIEFQNIPATKDLLGDKKKQWKDLMTCFEQWARSKSFKEDEDYARKPFQRSYSRAIKTKINDVIETLAAN